MSNKVPQIRFNGYSDDWEERKLENIAQINKGIQRGKQEISSVRNELNPYPVYNGGKKASGYTDECNRENSVMVSEGGASAGYVNYYSGKYWSGGHNFTISNDTKHDTFFLLYVLQKNQEKLYKLQVGTGLPNIQLKSIKDFPIYSTSNTEQQKIGSFFKQLDDTIALHQRKLDLLKEQKKGYLQKMFPKNGAKVPELRFAGFADDWEERKLEDISEIIDGDRGKNYPSGDDFKNNGHTLFLSAANVTKQGFVFKETQYITKLKSESLGSGKVILNDIILTSRGSIGHIGFYDKKTHEYIPQARINSGMLILRTDKLNSPSFIAQFLKSPWGIKQIKLISFGSAQPQLTKKDIKNFKIILPEMEEQQKIGSFFKQLDDTIALHQRKLELLKEQKKGFLQKMFV